MAPFVAAVLRDRVVADLYDENRQLRRQLDRSRAIEVLADHRNVKVVLAEGQLERGYFEADTKSNEKPKFKINFSKAFGCPLRAVRHLQIRMGGISLENLDPSSSESILHCDLTRTPWLDSHTTKGVILGSGDVSLVMIVYGWLWEDWSTVLRNIADGWEEPRQLVNYLLHVLPRKYPHATVGFQSLQLCAEKYKGPIDNLPKSRKRLRVAKERKI